VLHGDHGLLLFAVACRGIRANGPIENASRGREARALFSRSEHGRDAKLISRRLEFSGRPTRNSGGGSGLQPDWSWPAWAASSQHDRAVAADRALNASLDRARKRKPRSGETGLSDGDECLGDHSSISRANTPLVQSSSRSDRRNILQPLSTWRPDFLVPRSRETCEFVLAMF